MKSKTTVSARLTDNEISILNSICNSKKISKSEGIAYIIRSFATMQNQSILNNISSEIERTKNELNQQLFLIKSMLSNVAIDTKTSKYLTLYHFANSANKEVAKEYLNAAENRAISEVKK